MRKNILISCVIMLICTGCLGGKSVGPDYLRVGSAAQERGRSCVDTFASRPVLMVKRFRSLPSLDRETVMVADGAVLRPRFEWSWEGTPSEIFDLAAGPVLSCMNSYRVVAPYRPGLARDLQLSGTVLSFEVQKDGGPVFEAAIRFTLWDSAGGRSLAVKNISVSVPVDTMSASGVGAAADEAVLNLLGKASVWIDSLGGKMLLLENRR